MLDARRLQGRLGVPTEGIIGAGTLPPLFAKMGAAPAIAAELGLVLFMGGCQWHGFLTNGEWRTC